MNRNMLNQAFSMDGFQLNAKKYLINELEILNIYFLKNKFLAYGYYKNLLFVPIIFF